MSRGVRKWAFPETSNVGAAKAASDAYPGRVGSTNFSEIIGWASSSILLLTLGKQVHKQYRSGSSEGVSRWLFLGQVAASLGFTAYSWMVKNWVFVVTNALLLVNALVGYAIVLRHRRREQSVRSLHGASSSVKSS